MGTIGEHCGDTESRILIIGGGIGGAYTALNLLREGVPANRITIVADEWPTYTRHRLAEVLGSSAPLESIYLGVSEILEEAGVRVIKGRVTSVDTIDHVVNIDTGNGTVKEAYDNLVIASGGKPFKPPIPGSSLKGVYSFHGLGDLKALRTLPRHSKVVVIGAGLVGLTAAMALNRLGHRVAVVEIMQHVLPQLIDYPLVKPIEEYLSRNGVKLFLGVAAKKILGEHRIRGVLLGNGVFMSADAVVVATGVRPNTEFLRDAGLETLKGALVVDEWGRTTVKDVYAVGDCALSRDYVTGKQIYRPLGFVAAHYARLAAKAITGRDDGEQSVRGVIPTIYERIGLLHVTRIGLSMVEANKLGLSTEIKMLKEGVDSTWEAVVIDSDGRVVGWEHIALDPPRRSKAWCFYTAIRDGEDVSACLNNIA
ncbi:FAD-dependent oxidoreductase [Desulfurococcaceae archaeon MEX13E-LK6-19]|nr:FAD-dependent oxidoreductase [Desulfurococcaceae archaeon MEX13E-LK6-19]